MSVVVTHLGVRLRVEAAKTRPADSPYGVVLHVWDADVVSLELWIATCALLGFVEFMRALRLRKDEVVNIPAELLGDPVIRMPFDSWEILREKVVDAKPIVVGLLVFQFFFVNWRSATVLVKVLCLSHVLFEWDYTLIINFNCHLVQVVWPTVMNDMVIFVLVETIVA